MSEISLPIRERILYEFELKHNAATEASNMCAARGEGTVSERTCQRWFTRFKNGKMFDNSNRTFFDFLSINPQIFMKKEFLIYHVDRKLF